MVKTRNAIYGVLYGADTFLTEEEKTKLQELSYDLGKWHMLCRQEAHALSENRFQVRPKAHYAQELITQCRLINARAVQCYQSESMMGVMAQIYHKTCAGPYHKTVQRNVLIKYLI